MNQKLMGILREQTVQICDENGAPLGTGFFLTDNLVVTAAHCLYNKKNNTDIEQVSLCRHTTRLCKGMRLPAKNHIIAFIYTMQAFKQDNRLPAGYCDSLGYGVIADIYGYPQIQPEGYPLDDIKISGNYNEDGDDDASPSIQCLVRHKEGGLNRYDGLSGSPLVVQNCIVGMTATEDEGGNEVNAIHIYDFHCSAIREAFAKMQIPLKKICISIRHNERNLYKATSMSLYQKAWWLINNPDGNTIISDQYSIILATLLLGITGSADIILASPWESGLAECLREETVKYKKQFPLWLGRDWTEYADGAQPDWEMLEENAGVAVSVCAEDYSDISFAELLTGRRKRQKDILVLWNIWSEHPEQAVNNAVRASERFEPGAGKDLLTVFSSWQKNQAAERFPHTFLVQETIRSWLNAQTFDYLLQDAFLCSLNQQETDAVTWEIFQQYRDKPAEERYMVLKNLLQLCSASIRTMISFCEREDEMAVLLETESADLKRWFASAKESECSKILSCLKQDQALYWNAVISNPYCTRYVIQEWCTRGRKIFVQLLLEQDRKSCNDIFLQNEADTIRWQIRPQ